jgi:hypothetical protein
MLYGTFSKSLSGHNRKARFRGHSHLISRKLNTANDHSGTFTKEACKKKGDA